MTRSREHPAREHVAERADPPPRALEDPNGVISLQRSAGNAAVSRLMASGADQRQVQRWANLGTEHWEIRGLGGRHSTLWTGSKQEWLGVLGNMDDEDEYKDRLQAFLEVSNRPSLVGRERPPSHIASNPEDVNYSNTYQRVPTAAEKLAFLEALFEKAAELDLWHGGPLEGGPWIHYADADLSAFIANHQDLYLVAMSNAGQAINVDSVAAVADQGGIDATMSMIMNAGATAHKGVEMVMAANRETGQTRETRHSQAMELVRNSGRTIRAALQAHDARVEFRREVVGAVFDHVWDLIPGGGQLAEAGKAALKFGFEQALENAMEEDGPSQQAEQINREFVATCNRLVREGHVMSADAQDAINGFEAVRR